MTQYMLSVTHVGAYPDATTQEAQGMFERVGAFNEKLMAEGKWVFGAGLEPLDTSTRVDGRGDEAIVTDGAYSESKEYVGGFWIIEAADLDEALKLAAEGSKACGQVLIVRPLQGV